MTCVLCLFNNPPASPCCLRCRRAVAPSIAVEDDDERVSFDPVLMLLVDSGSSMHQPTGILNTLDLATDETPASVLFPPIRPTLN